MSVLTESFAANTGQFTTFGYGGFGLGTFGVSGGQGLLSLVGGSNFRAINVIENSWPIGVPNFFVSATVGTPTWATPPPGTFLNFCVGLAHDVNNQVLVEVGTEATSGLLYFDVVVLLSGSQHNFTTGTSPINITSLPTAIGMGMQGHIVSVWLQFSGVWQTSAVWSVDISSMVDFNASGNLNGWFPAFHLDDGGAGGVGVSMGISQFQFTQPNPAPGATPYQNLILSDGPWSYVPGNELSFPNVDIIQHINDASAVHPTYGNPSLVGLGGEADGMYVSPGISQISFTNPFFNAPPLAMSAEMWINTSQTLANDGNYGLFSRSVGVFADVGGQGLHTDWGLAFGYPFVPTVGIGSDQSVGDSILTSATSINDGKWHHLVMTWNNNGAVPPAVTSTAKIYIDGVLDCSSTAMNSGARIGLSIWYSGNNTNGWIGSTNNLAVYPYELSPTQVLNHYNAGINVPTSFQAVFVPALAFKATMVANADGIFPQAYLPKIDSTARVTPQRIPI